MLLDGGVVCLAAFGAFQLHHFGGRSHELKSLAQPLWPLPERHSTARRPENTSNPRYNYGMAVRLIALDIDGTLLDSLWTLPEAKRSAIPVATPRRIVVALLTGPRYHFAMFIAVLIGAP